MLRAILLLVGGLVLAIVLVVITGALLPVAHVASMTRHYDAPPDRVWQAITGVEQFASWRPELKSATRLPPIDGKPRWREKMSSDSLTIEVTESTPPARLVTRIADEGLPFGGTWTYELKPANNGTDLTITEHGEVYNVVFRFMSRFVFGHTNTMKKYHKALLTRTRQI